MIPILDLVNRNFKQHYHRHYLSLNEPTNEADTYVGNSDFSIHRKRFSSGKKSRKAWKKLMWNIIDCCRTNAWILYRSCKVIDRSYTHKDFVLDLGKELIGNFSRATRALRETSPMQGAQHLEHTFGRLLGNRRRCRGCCKKKRRLETVYGCPICNIHFCYTCFRDYHPTADNYNGDTCHNVTVI